MSTINDGDPAFPWSPDGPNYQKYSGITIRDYFAAHAPEKPDWYRLQVEQNNQRPGEVVCAKDGIVYEPHLTSVGRWAFAYADAMLKARENKE